jgi:hypothetical protein
MIEQLLQELSPLPTQMSHELFEVESKNMSSGIILFISLNVDKKICCFSTSCLWWKEYN